ncbi:histidine phosphatase family protein [Deinococcus radiopugnans]|uniref:histidine phosphatase family protein n=1 Tax=Deinococcus radiopugnans TaxID=57497 RepID=UPI0036145941
MTLTLYLVRHAPTAPNAERRYPRADEDAPLSPTGRAVAAGLRLPSHALALTSPSLRARQTAELAGFPDAVSTSALCEAQFGVMGGRTWAELEAQFGDAPRGWIDALGEPTSETGPPGARRAMNFMPGFNAG